MRDLPLLDPILEEREESRESSSSNYVQRESLDSYDKRLSGMSSVSDYLPRKPRSSFSRVSTSAGHIPDDIDMDKIYQRLDMKCKSEVRLEYSVRSRSEPSEATLLEISFFERPFGIWLMKKEVFRIDHAALCQFGLQKYYEVVAVRPFDGEEWQDLTEEDDAFVQEMLLNAEVPFTVRFRNPREDYIAEAEAIFEEHGLEAGESMFDNSAYLSTVSSKGDPDLEIWEDEWV